VPEPIETPYLRAAFLAGALAAAASVTSAAVVLLLAGTGGDTALDVIRPAVRAWLVAIGSGLTFDGASITIVPIGGWLLGVGVVAWVVRWSLPDPVDELPAFVVSTAGVFGLLAGISAAVSSTDGAEIGLVRAAAAGFVVGGAGAACGAVSKHGGGAALWFTVSQDLRRAVRGAIPAIIAMLVASTVIVLTLLLLHRDRAGDLWALLDPGAGGGIALAIASVLAVPTAVLWTCSVLLGPGFALGSDTSVDLTGAHLGAVPGFPFLAALPSPGEFSSWVFVLGLVPLIAGGFSGWRADTGGRDGWRARIVAGAAAGATAGFLLGVVVGASGGAIGPGRMAHTGPPPLTPLLVGVLVMGLGGALGAALAHYRELRATSRNTPDPSPAGGPDLGKRHDPPGPDRRDDRS